MSVRAFVFEPASVGKACNNCELSMMGRNTTKEHPQNSVKEMAAGEPAGRQASGQRYRRPVADHPKRGPCNAVALRRPSIRRRKNSYGKFLNLILEGLDEGSASLIRSFS